MGAQYCLQVNCLISPFCDTAGDAGRNDRACFKEAGPEGARSPSTEIQELGMEVPGVNGRDPGGRGSPSLAPCPPSSLPVLRQGS